MGETVDKLSYDIVMDVDGTYNVVIRINKLSKSQADSMVNGIKFAIRLALKKGGK